MFHGLKVTWLYLCLLLSLILAGLPVGPNVSPKLIDIAVSEHGTVIIQSPRADFQAEPAHGPPKVAPVRPWR
jgi:hypothetical protein